MNPQNKKQLVRVVTEELQKEGFRQRLTGEHLCTTTEESCVEISADYFQTKRRSDVNSRQTQTPDFLFTHLMQPGMVPRLFLNHQKI